MLNYQSIFRLLALCLACLITSYADCKEFLSTKFQVSVRASPSTNSYVKWVYLKPNEPVQIISSFANWRKIKDCEHDIGWVHVSALAKKRFVVIQSKKQLHKEPSSSSKLLAKLKPGVRCELKKVSGDWLQVATSGITGWITSAGTWGI